MMSGKRREPPLHLAKVERATQQMPLEPRCYHRPVIIDFHAHVFPPPFLEQRERYLQQDPTFRELYSSPASRLATADDLLASMDRAGVDAAIILGFAWSNADTCREHNEYLLDCAAKSGGRLIPFCTLQPREPDAAMGEARRCARAGARGLGELRPDNQGFTLDGRAGEALARGAEEERLVLLFHVSEPAGHSYPGKRGLDIGAFLQFAESAPAVNLVAAHWGGGLPFYTLMPEVGAALRRTWFDTAASSLLYDGRVFRAVIDLVGADRVLFGSDYPLLSQEGCLEAIRSAPLTEPERALVLGENARALLGLE
jgi:uncharacterized protein